MQWRKMKLETERKPEGGEGTQFRESGTRAEVTFEQRCGGPEGGDTMEFTVRRWPGKWV